MEFSVGNVVKIKNKFYKFVNDDTTNFLSEFVGFIGVSLEIVDIVSNTGRGICCENIKNGKRIYLAETVIEIDKIYYRKLKLQKLKRTFRFNIGDVIKLTEYGFDYYFIAASKEYKKYGKESWVVIEACDGYCKVEPLSNRNNGMDDMFLHRYMELDKMYYRKLKLEKLCNLK